MIPGFGLFSKLFGGESAAEITEENKIIQERFAQQLLNDHWASGWINFHPENLTPLRKAVRVVGYDSLDALVSLIKHREEQPTEHILFWPAIPDFLTVVKEFQRDNVPANEISKHLQFIYEKAKHVVNIDIPVTMAYVLAGPRLFKAGQEANVSGVLRGVFENTDFTQGYDTQKRKIALALFGNAAIEGISNTGFELYERSVKCAIALSNIEGASDEDSYDLGQVIVSAPSIADEVGSNLDAIRIYALAERAAHKDCVKNESDQVYAMGLAKELCNDAVRYIKVINNGRSEVRAVLDGLEAVAETNALVAWSFLRKFNHTIGTKNIAHFTSEIVPELIAKSPYGVDPALEQAKVRYNPEQ